MERPPRKGVRLHIPEGGSAEVRRNGAAGAGIVAAARSAAAPADGNARRLLGGPPPPTQPGAALAGGSLGPPAEHRLCASADALERGRAEAHTRECALDGVAPELPARWGGFASQGHASACTEPAPRAEPKDFVRRSPVARSALDKERGPRSRPAWATRGGGWRTPTSGPSSPEPGRLLSAEEAGRMLVPPRQCALGGGAPAPPTRQGGVAFCSHGGTCAGPAPRAGPKHTVRPDPAARSASYGERRSRSASHGERRSRVHCAKAKPGGGWFSPTSSPEPGRVVLSVAETARLPEFGRFPHHSSAASSGGPLVLPPRLPPGPDVTAVYPCSRSPSDYFDGL